MEDKKAEVWDRGGMGATTRSYIWYGLLVQVDTVAEKMEGLIAQCVQG